jgi:hypothetical protein
MNTGKIPYLPIVVGFCIAAIAGYAVFSGWAVFIARDATMIGDVIGTWKSFAVLAFGFWLGSSSGGKAKDEAPAPPPGPALPNPDAAELAEQYKGENQ